MSSKLKKHLLLHTFIHSYITSFILELQSRLKNIFENSNSIKKKKKGTYLHLKSIQSEYSFNVRCLYLPCMFTHHSLISEKIESKKAIGLVNCLTKHLSEYEYKNSRPYGMVTERIQRTSSCTTINIQRVQNSSLTRLYTMKKLQMEERTGDCVEQVLFHGTTPEGCLAINRFGFNRSYCGRNDN